MASLTINIPDAVAARVSNSFATAHGYESMILDGSLQLIPNPETRGQFLKRKVIEFIKESVKGAEAHAAAEAAGSAAAAEAETEISLS